MSASARDAAASGRIALLIALAALVVALPLVVWAARLLAWVLRRPPSRAPRPGFGLSLVVGADNRTSTSKTVATVWTYSLAGALLSFVVARWLGHSTAFDVLRKQGLNVEYAVLIGGPIGAAILAKGIVSAQLDSGSAVKSTADAPTPAQLVENDAGQADLGDLQYVLFNAVALVFFYGELLRAPQLGIPTIPDVLLTLTSVSAVGYLGKKVLSGPAGVTDVSPAAAPVGEMVTIATAGVIQGTDDLHALTVKFGELAATPGSLSATTTTSFGVLVSARVPDGVSGLVPVTVATPGAQPTPWAKKLAIRPRLAGDHLSGRQGQQIPVRTTGVVSPGKPLHNVRVTIADRPADVDVRDGQLLVTIPTDAPVGAGELVLVTDGGPATGSVMVAPAAGAEPGAGPRDASALVPSANGAGGHETHAR